MTSTLTNCSLPNQPTELIPSTGSITQISAEDPETVLEQLAFVEPQLKGLIAHREHLLDLLSEAAENGRLDDYRNIGNEKQIVWEDLTITQASRTTKTFADDVKKQIDLIKYEATRQGQFTKKTTQYWTLNLAAQ